MSDSIIVLLQTHPEIRQAVLNEVKVTLHGAGIAVSEILHVNRSLAPWGLVTRAKVLNDMQFATHAAGIDSTANVLRVSFWVYGDYGGRVSWRASTSLIFLGSSEVPTTQRIEGRTPSNEWPRAPLHALQDVLLSTVNTHVAHR
jgi:hypothetical protein